MAGQDLAHGFQLGGGAAGAQDAAVGACPQDAAGLQLCIVAGDNEKLQARMQHQQILHQLKDTASRHAQADQHQIRLLLADSGKGAGGAGHGCRQGEVWLGFQLGAKVRQAGWMAVHDDDSIRGFHFRLGVVVGRLKLTSLTWASHQRIGTKPLL